MKINDTQRIGAMNNYRKNNQQQAEVTGKKQKKDEIQISAEAQELLTQQTQGEDPIRAEKLNELKQSVASGTYSVDPRKLAEKLFPYIK
ncbi:hypothetical protein SY83_10965 [Paenibacillus swuensis]|uniref:Negative regulator of flagellin synthesis n=1 Tax=Paenibacillus swuensis TaxID=1178515 RepID=A0A172TIC2_9BACL|nr:flagellar biosynthesis anti-sigma factor FlgM [Paenibacillus swuensis]ANE46706.1 hypothetical protein SY83_10965 [Paenibacillus swuensis]